MLRIEYCDIMWVEDGRHFTGGYDFPIYNTLGKTVKAVMEKIR